MRGGFFTKFATLAHGVPYQRNTVQQRRLHSDRVVQNIVLFAHTMYVCKNVYIHTSCTLTISLGVIKNVENVSTLVEKSIFKGLFRQCYIFCCLTRPAGEIFF